MTKLPKLVGRFTAWSPSRLTDYEACPLSAGLKHLDKLCTSCFKGKLSGGFDTPAVCTACKAVFKPGPALVRGSHIGKSLEDFVTGRAPDLFHEITNPHVVRIASEFRDEYAKDPERVKVEVSYIFDENWRPLKGMFPPGAWLRVRLDVLEYETGRPVLAIVDWKTGGIDKRTGEIRSSEKYDDQLDLYCVAALSADTAAAEARAALVFVDAPGVSDPVVARPVGLKRSGLKAAQKRWAKRILPMLSDDQFAPRPSADACRFCPFRRDLGGPCPI
jgi:hypothetical protein